MWYVCDILYAVLYVRVSCFIVRGCAVSRRYINVCNCDMFSVVYVYHDHLRFCDVCIDGRRYVCCSECNVVSNECILQLTTDIETGFNLRKPPHHTVCVAIDLTAAFDTVSHDILISNIVGSSLPLPSLDGCPAT